MNKSNNLGGDILHNLCLNKCNFKVEFFLKIIPQISQLNKFS